MIMKTSKKQGSDYDITHNVKWIDLEYKEPYCTTITWKEN